MTKEFEKDEEIIFCGAIDAGSKIKKTKEYVGMNEVLLNPIEVTYYKFCNKKLLT